jgi:hypothetical protein
MAAAFAGEDIFKLPLRRIGHGSGHGIGSGFFHHLAFRSLFFHGFWSIPVMIGVLIAVAFLIRWVARSRQRRGTQYWD